MSTDCPVDVRPRRLNRRKLEKVVTDGFWRGFCQGLGDGLKGGLEYASTSGLYDYNAVRRIAENAGWTFAQQVFADYEDRKARKEAGRPRRLSTGLKYDIPASVWAECYAAGGIG